MAQERQFMLFDSFTKLPFNGTPTALVPDADGLSDFQMIQMSRELNVGEAVFMFKADEDNDVRVRFITPAHEVDLSGHACLALPHVLGNRPDEKGYARTVVGTNLGNMTLLTDFKDDMPNKVFLKYLPPRFWKTMVDSESIIRSLGLRPQDLDEDLPCQMVSTGLPSMVVPLKTRDAVERINPVTEAISNVSREFQIHGFIAFCNRDAGEGYTARTRVFSPYLGVLEDPATGVASANLSAYMFRHALVNHTPGSLSLKFLQGNPDQRTGVIHSSLEMDEKGLKSILVGGHGVVSARGTLLVPDDIV